MQHRAVTAGGRPPYLTIPNWQKDKHKHINAWAVTWYGDNDNYENGQDDDDNCINDNNLYDDDDDGVVGYIILSTRHDNR